MLGLLGVVLEYLGDVGFMTLSYARREIMVLNH
jgi:hypothetical protein